MSDKESSYTRAVRLFCELNEAPLQGRHATPRALAASCGIPPSSGYRALYSMESAGLLKRNSSGAYLRGEMALRIGLAALGMGELAVLAQPVLEQLRRETRLSAFLGLLKAQDLVMGPLSFGQGSHFAIPAKQQLTISHREPLAQAADTGIMGEFLVLDSHDQVFSALVLPVGKPYPNAMLGLFHKQTRQADFTENLIALERARSRLQRVP